MTAKDIERKHGPIKDVQSFHDLVEQSAQAPGVYRFQNMIVVSYPEGKPDFYFGAIQK